MRAPAGLSALDRLHLRTAVDAEGCWLWRGWLNHGGYGQIKYQGVTQFTHRLAYRELIGPIPEGLQLDHLCRKRNCWRPDHLEPVTPQENTRRSPDQPAANNARRTHCYRGHPLSGENLAIRLPRNRPPQRICRICKRIRDRKVTTDHSDVTQDAP